VRHRRLSIGLSIALTLGLVPTVAAAATIRVDDDGKASAGSCSGTASAPKSIQKAIVAAGKNGTVIVCPGTYRGALRITGKQDGITVRSAVTGKATVIQASTTPNGTDLVTVTADADDVAFRGFRLAAPASGCRTQHAIRAQGRKVVIADNRIVGGNFCFQDGIRVDQNELVSKAVGATVRGNTIKNTEWRGINVEGSDVAPVTATLRGNTITGAGDWSDPGAEHVLQYGIAVERTSGTIVKDNTVTNARYGIYLLDVSLSNVEQNTLTDLDTGIAALAVTDNTFTGNTLTTGRDGILAQGALVDDVITPSTGNTFSGNVSTGHSNLDCTDTSNGTGTLDTANTWTGNTGDGADVPNGICPAPAP
jgi:parallel beta-helix repeat protein